MVQSNHQDPDCKCEVYVLEKKNDADIVYVRNIWEKKHHWGTTWRLYKGTKVNKGKGGDMKLLNLRLRKEECISQGESLGSRSLSWILKISQ